MKAAERQGVPGLDPAVDPRAGPARPSALSVQGQQTAGSRRRSHSYTESDRVTPSSVSPAPGLGRDLPRQQFLVCGAMAWLCRYRPPTQRNRGSPSRVCREPPGRRSDRRPQRRPPAPAGWKRPPSRHQPDDLCLAAPGGHRSGAEGFAAAGVTLSRSPPAVVALGRTLRCRPGRRADVDGVDDAGRRRLPPSRCWSPGCRARWGQGQPSPFFTMLTARPARLHSPPSPRALRRSSS